MSEFTIRKGLDLPIGGKAVPPSSRSVDSIPVSQIGVNGYDSIGLKPKLLVSEGDRVLKGQPIFIHKTHPDIAFTATKSGKVAQITRGQKRFLENVIIDIDEKNPDNLFKDALPKKAFSLSEIESLKRNDLIKIMLSSGLWPSLRVRPLSKPPSPTSEIASIFVTAADSEPLAPDPKYAIKNYHNEFEAGVVALSVLAPNIHVCVANEYLDLPNVDDKCVKQYVFNGPHPSGLVGTHIHFIDPVDSNYSVWHIGYQEVISLGKLLLEQELFVERIISLAGPAALNPRIVSVPVGANIKDIAENESPSSRKIRAISGSMLSGQGLTRLRAFMSRFHNQITLLYNDPHRDFMGWIVPSTKRYSNARVHLSSLFGKKDNLDFSTNTNGSPRAMVPFGLFESVVPLDVLPTQLLRSLLVLDTDMAQQLGCLELDEEDLALCSYCCFSKYEYGVALRETLTKIEKEG